MSGSPAVGAGLADGLWYRFWQYQDGYLYMLGLSAKPGHSSSEPPWFTVTRVNIHRAGLNQTMYLRQWSDASPALPATIAFGACVAAAPLSVQPAGMLT